MSGYCNYIRKAACLRFQRSMLLSNILEKERRTPLLQRTNKNRDVIKHTFDHAPINSSNLFDLQRIII